MKDNSRIFRLVKKSNLLERIIKGYNLVQKLESEKNYRCQYAPYLLTLAQKVNSFEIPELNELRLSTPGWDSVVEIVEKTNKLLKDYQNASTFTPGQRNDFDDEFIANVESDDDEKDYDIEISEVLLSKIEIESM